MFVEFELSYSPFSVQADVNVEKMHQVIREDKIRGVNNARKILGLSYCAFRRVLTLHLNLTLGGLLQTLCPV
jgi:hypothetical protein